ncbi:WD40 repeat-like protein [Schizopora paradoxa]|uniref:WD40 repeat-like protein n=1 Tax=Schizopora paradoxa TaxID=27342 RepID=A0A0H2S250_9AGAM|nr:WD40 repeat-like protein [Schizopora paradoxa]
MRSLLELLADARSIARLTSVKNAVMDIMKAVVNCSYFINDFINKGRFKQFGAAQTHSKLDEHRENLEKLRKRLGEALNLQVADSVDGISGVVNKIAKDDEDERTQELLSKRLAPAEQQSLGSPCLKGTRTSILAEVEKWMKDTNQPNVFWISGAPGAGKSTISTTIVKEILTHKCARFFVKRSATPELRDPRRIWPTIAFALAGMHRHVKDEIVDVLGKKAECPKDVEVGDQFHDLLVTPFQRLAESSSVVVVIDALDECRTSDDDWNHLLATLARWSELPSNVKLIITSRRETDIQNRLQPVSRNIILETGDDTSNETSDDIRLYFETSFRDMAVLDAGAPWPGEVILNDLTRYAAGLFIWAKTVVKFVGHKNLHPPSRLKLISDNMDRRNADIDDLYGQILYEMFTDMETEEQYVTKFVLATIAMAKAPLGINDLVELLAPEGGDQRNEMVYAVQYSVQALGPIINVWEPDGRLSVCHKTLSDFIFDEYRTRDVIKRLLARAQKPSDDGDLERYITRRPELSVRLAEACLRLLNSRLAFNICRLSTSHCRNDALPNRRAIVINPIPSYLIYACQHWAEHLEGLDENISHDFEKILNPLKIFLFTHILHWLEVLSLTNSTDHAPHLLLFVERYTKRWDKSENLSDIILDANRFSTMFQDAIAESAPHIYLSALPFAPASSKMAQIYGPLVPGTLSLRSGRKQDWDHALLEISGHEGIVQCLAYFPNGDRIASGGDNTVRIWDAYNAKAVSGMVFEHPDTVQNLHISPGGDRIVVFCEDGTLKVWNVTDGRCIYATKVTCKYLTPVAFSQDGALCAFVSQDEIINVLEVQDRGRLTICAQLLVDPPGMNEVYSLAFSVDKPDLLFGSVANMIITWDARDGEIVGEPYKSRKGIPVPGNESLAVSEDGKLLALGFCDGVVELWDLLRGELRGELERKRGKDVSSVSFSPNGKSTIIATGSDDGSICYWDTATLAQIGGPYFGLRFNGAGIGPVSFSPDGRRVVSSVLDLIRVWDATTSMHHIVPDAYNAYAYNQDVGSIALDGEGRRCACGGVDGSVRIWDITSGTMLAEGNDNTSANLADPYVAKEIRAMVFSPGGDSILSCSREGKCREWCSRTGQIRREVLIEKPDEDSNIRRRSNVVMSSDGRYVAFQTQVDSVSLFDCVSGREVNQYVVYDDGDLNAKRDVPMAIALNPQGDLIALGTSNGTIWIWRVETEMDKEPTSIAVIRGNPERGLAFITFSPHARQIASCFSDGSLGIWDFENHSMIFFVHDDIVYDRVSFSPHGNTIAPASVNGMVRFWSGATGENIGQLLVHHKQSIRDISFSSDGVLLYTLSFFGSLKVWHMDSIKHRSMEMNSIQSLDSLKFVEVTFDEGASTVPPRHILRNKDKGFPTNSISISSCPAFFDGKNEAAIGDWSYIDSDGWLRNRRVKGEESEDDPMLFWVPPANRRKFWWPRTVAIVDTNKNDPVTCINFSRFMHGEKWQRCVEKIAHNNRMIRAV